MFTFWGAAPTRKISVFTNGLTTDLQFNTTPYITVETSSVVVHWFSDTRLQSTDSCCDFVKLQNTVTSDPFSWKGSCCLLNTKLHLLRPDWIARFNLIYLHCDQTTITCISQPRGLDSYRASQSVFWRFRRWPWAVYPWNRCTSLDAGNPANVSVPCVPLPFIDQKLIRLEKFEITILV